jgi:hypothetical protein
MKKRTNPRKRTKRTNAKRPETSRVRRKTQRVAAAEAGGQDQPNVARLIITMTSVEGEGAERMSFTASAGVGRSVHFGEDSPERVLYDGPYTPGPYQLSVQARELDPSSDDTFTPGTGSFDIDMTSLEGQGQVEITMVPEKDENGDNGGAARMRRGKSRKRGRAAGAAAEQEDESASYTVFFTGKIEPAIEITNVDVINREITFDLTPESLGEGNFLAIISSKQVDKDPKLDDVTVISQQVSGGRGQKLKFEWSVFAQKGFTTPFHAQSLNVYWNNLRSSPANDTYTNLHFIAMGTFSISGFVTPDDNFFGGTTEQATFAGGKRTVHSTWISHVRCEEGKGVSLGDVVQILGPGKCNKTRTVFVHKAGTQRLVVGNEGSWGIRRLTINKSLAKHKSDRRFRANDTILLSTDPGVLFAIEDEGNWDDDPPGPHNHLDRYRGFGGATRPAPFADAYVVKL